MFTIVLKRNSAIYSHLEVSKRYSWLIIYSQLCSLDPKMASKTLPAVLNCKHNTQKNYKALGITAFESLTITCNNSQINSSTGISQSSIDCLYTTREATPDASYLHTTSTHVTVWGRESKNVVSWGVYWWNYSHGEGEHLTSRNCVSVWKLDLRLLTLQRKQTL